MASKNTAKNSNTKHKKKKKKIEYISQSGIMLTYGLSKKDIDKYFPDPVLRTNPHYSSAAPLRLWDIRDVKKLLRKPVLKAKYEAFLQKKLEEEQRRQEIRTYLQQFNPDYLIETGRKLKRIFVLHVGPTNSGKTYHALQALRQCRSGVYLGPLRLLALEMFDTLNADGIPCSLLTGEEREDVNGAQITASTIELCDFNRSYEVAVIDEAQLIADPSRGAHWMQAVCLVNADEVHICLAPESEELITNIIRAMGAEMQVIHHERLVPLEFAGRIFSHNHIEPGDAVIAFSRKRVLSIAAQLENAGMMCSVIYGALPPAARREQVRRFASGETSVVVATDAIGMGISLPIRRVIFSEEVKFDGSNRRVLNISEIKQIAGRAGRFGKYDLGQALSMSSSDIIERGMREPSEVLTKLRIPFPKEALRSDYDLRTLLEVWKDLPKNEEFAREDVSEAIFLLDTLGRYSKKIAKSFIYELVTCPVDTKSYQLVSYWYDSAKAIIHGQPVALPNFEDDSLESCEIQYKALDIYHQLMRRIGIETDLSEEKDRLCQKISSILSNSKENYLLRCRQCGKQLPMNYEFTICKRCYKANQEYEASFF